MKRVIAFLLLLIAASSVVLAITDDCAGLSDPDKKVTCYENKISENQGQQKTLASTIAYINNKIYLILSQIEKTERDIKALEEEINVLEVKITNLDINLNDVSKLLIARVGEAYKRSAFNPTFQLLTSGGLTDFFERAKYLKAAQQNDQKLLLQMQESRDQSQQQKELKETKQAELESLKQRLATQNKDLLQQKKSKQVLLEVTKNDEKRYQYLFNLAKEEQQASAIQCSGGKITYNIGNLAVRGNINAGERIGTMGNTGGPGCSSGAHLHLEYITEGKIEGDKLTGIINNPLNFLTGQTVKWVTDDNSIAEGSFGSGANIWPLNNSIITQFFGKTPYSNRYACGLHTGLDTVDLDNKTVRAAREGKLYTGTLVCNASSSLINTAIIDHGGGVFSTYLHLSSF